MKYKTLILVSALLATLLGARFAAAAEDKLRIVVTHSAYQSIAERIGGDKVTVSHIVEGNQDPHLLRPKPSLAVRLRDANLYVATGLDLELWSDALVNMSGNPRIRSGQPGYVAASAGLELMEIPTSMSRSAGDVHVYGNPHIHTSPLHGKTIAENICVGLKRNAPDHAAYFDQNLQHFVDELDRRTFGPELVRLLGGKTLSQLARKQKLIPFLQQKNYQGSPLIGRLGGWMKDAMPLRGRKLVTYHKSLTYFTDLFGIEVVGYLEPKPGIPPTAGHVASIIETMRKQHVKVIWVENYFDVAKVRKIAERAGAIPVAVALGPGGQPGMNDFFDQFTIWIQELNRAFEQADRG